jgi:hypothetical protein
LMNTNVQRVSFTLIVLKIGYRFLKNTCPEDDTIGDLCLMMIYYFENSNTYNFIKIYENEHNLRI